MRKIKVLIADDEPFITQGLKVLLDWQELGCEIIAEANDGRKCLALIHQHKPDIVITDIRMPGLSGIELIRMTPPEFGTRFIVLSGYSDFEYARQCMALGVREYLLKPVEEAQLVAAIQRISHDKEEEQLRNTALQHAAERHVQMERLSQDYFWRDFVNSYFEETDNLDALLARQGISMPPAEAYCCILLELQEQRQNVRSRIELAMAREYPERFFVFPDLDNRYMVILALAAELGKKDLASRLEQIRQRLSNDLGCQISIGIGGCCREMHKIPVSARQAQLAMSFRIVHGENTVNSFSSGLDNAHFILAIPQTLLSGFSSAVATLNHMEISSSLERIFAYLQELGDMPLLGVQINAINLILIAIRCIEELNASRAPIRYEMLNCYDRIAKAESIDEMSAYVRNVVYDMINGIQQADASRLSDLMLRVQEYLREHIYEDVSLVTVAHVFFISPIYLSRRFKKECRMLYVDYMASLKMETARKLLEDPELKIYEVANKLGYKDVRYFSQVFREKWGVSPSEYRRSGGA